MLMERAQAWLPPQMLVLIAEFWLSGLFILSIIFTQPDSQALEQLNLFMFISLGAGSLLGGYASDYFDRIKVFKAFMGVWGVASVLMTCLPQVGYILASGCIGLLNNLTFVIIMEHFPAKKEPYTVYVLIGWAASEITLGLFFLFFQSNSQEGAPLFYFVLFALGMMLTIAVFLFLDFDLNPSLRE